MTVLNVDPANLTRGNTEKSIVYIGAAQGWRLALSLVSTVVFARLLSPHDFGLVAMVAPLVAFATLLQDMGLSQVAVQRERVTERLLSALFWLNTAIGLLFAVVLVIVSPVIAAFYGHAELAGLASAFAGVILVTSLQTQHLALSNRRMDFFRIAVIETVATTLAFLAGLCVAIVWASYWALFVVHFTTVTLSGIFFWATTGWRPRIGSFEGEFREIARFGLGLTGHAILSFLTTNADNVLIGRFHGSVALGLYDRAYKLLLLPIHQVNTPLGRVIIPLLSRLRGDPRRYTSAYREALTALMTALQSPIIVLIVFANPLFETVLGSAWVAAAPIFQILGICGLQQILCNSYFWLFVSQGRARELFLLSLFRCVATVGAFAAGLPWGPIGVAAAYTIAEIVLRLPVQTWVVTRAGPITLTALSAVVLPQVAAALVSAGVALAAGGVDAKSPVIQAAVVLFLCYICHLLVLLLFPSQRAAISIYLFRMVGFLKRHYKRHSTSS